MAESINATFFAFRKREKSGVLTRGAIAFAVLLLLATLIFGAAVFFLLGGEAFWTSYTAMVQQGGDGVKPGADLATPNMAGALLIFPLELVFLIAMFVLIASFESASVRWMVRGETSGPLGLHFGADMWRVYGTYWVWFLYVILSFILCAVWMFIVGAVTSNFGDAPWIPAVLAVGYFLAWIYVTIRLSPAAATSVGIGEFAPLKAWRVSRGRFWALFGAYLLLFIVYAVVFSVLGALFFGAFYAQLLSGLDWSTMSTDPEGFASAYEQSATRALQSLYSSPTAIALYVGGQLLMWALAMVFYVLWFGVASRAVQAALEEGKIERAPAAA